MPSVSTTIAAAAMGAAVVSAIVAVRSYAASRAPNVIAYVRPAMRDGEYYALLCVVNNGTSGAWDVRLHKTGPILCGSGADRERLEAFLSAPIPYLAPGASRLTELGLFTEFRDAMGAACPTVQVWHAMRPRGRRRCRGSFPIEGASFSDASYDPRLS